MFPSLALCIFTFSLLVLLFFPLGVRLPASLTWSISNATFYLKSFPPSKTAWSFFFLIYSNPQSTLFSAMTFSYAFQRGSLMMPILNFPPGSWILSSLRTGANSYRSSFFPLFLVPNAGFYTMKLSSKFTEFTYLEDLGVFVHSICTAPSYLALSAFQSHCCSAL